MFAVNVVLDCRLQISAGHQVTPKVFNLLPVQGQKELPSINMAQRGDFLVVCFLVSILHQEVFSSRGVGVGGVSQKVSAIQACQRRFERFTSQM